jgi:hypothetical protein
MWAGVTSLIFTFRAQRVGEALRLASLLRQQSEPAATRSKGRLLCRHSEQVLCGRLNQLPDPA